MDIEWRSVVGQPAYEVSNRGDVRNTRTGKLLKLIPTRNPKRENWYYCVRLSIGGRRLPLVHRLMLEAFDVPCPPGKLARHLNDIGTDNRWPENLVWGSYEENFADAAERGPHGWALYNLRRH